MSPRSYRMGKREAGVAATRGRIIESARRLLIQGEARDFTVEEVARRADVARATVYYQFGSKLGLLEAVAKDAERRAGIGRFARTDSIKDGGEAVRYILREICRFWAADREVFQKMIGLAAVDPDVRRVVQTHDEDRRANIARFVNRPASQALLAPGVSKRRAVDTLWLLTSFETFDHLVTKSGQSVDSAAATLILLARPLLRS